MKWSSSTLICSQIAGSGTRPRRFQRFAKISSDTLSLEQAEHKEVLVKDFGDGFFPFDGTRIDEFFEELKSCVSPDLIFTHYRDGRHQIQRTISHLT
jgi:hypothetical protein